MRVLIVFPRRRGRRIPVFVQGFVDDGQGVFDLGLDGFQELGVDVLCEEGVEFALEVEADVAQVGGVGGVVRGSDPAIDSGTIGGWRHYAGCRGWKEGGG